MTQPTAPNKLLFAPLAGISRLVLLPLLLLTCAADPAPPAAPSAPPEPTPAPPQVPDPGGCPASVAALPPSPLWSAEDPRLQGHHLVVVFKAARRAGVYQQGALARTDEGPACWQVALGYGPEGVAPLGPKQRRGDVKTPEGWYRSSDKPWSQFYGALAVHYPNADDARRGLEQGLITRNQYDGILSALARDQKPNQETALGGEILLHGGGSSSDWTLGCVALENQDIDALRALLPDSFRTDVLILP